jgi:hypothetical protein
LVLPSRLFVVDPKRPYWNGFADTSDLSATSDLYPYLGPLAYSVAAISFCGAAEEEDERGEREREREEEEGAWELG